MIYRESSLSLFLRDVYGHLYLFPRKLHAGRGPAGRGSVRPQRIPRQGMSTAIHPERTTCLKLEVSGYCNPNNYRVNRNDVFLLQVLVKDDCLVTLSMTGLRIDP